MICHANSKLERTQSSLDNHSATRSTSVVDTFGDTSAQYPLTSVSHQLAIIFIDEVEATACTTTARAFTTSYQTVRRLMRESQTEAVHNKTLCAFSDTSFLR